MSMCNNGSRKCTPSKKSKWTPINGLGSPSKWHKYSKDSLLKGANYEMHIFQFFHLFSSNINSLLFKKFLQNACAFILLCFNNSIIDDQSGQINCNRIMVKFKIMYKYGYCIYKSTMWPEWELEDYYYFSNKFWLMANVAMIPCFLFSCVMRFYDQDLHKRLWSDHIARFFLFVSWVFYIFDMAVKYPVDGSETVC